ncbi:TonB-dependent receptor [Steroidobacter sp.]|uniref:TonB-dependent receptor n=1 Tax=Steroidobacter sp. TaxID=1978227 RepID=UPI001A4CF223|nr:TonB-dependent receptor [Steroidobacter sp.]MBL8268537.1 TonB-dependent receptor [Steroidobacter sp.]
MRLFERSGLLVALALAGGLACAAEPSKAVVALDIPAKPVGDALNDFARQSGLQIAIRPEHEANIRSAPVTGSYTPDEGLKALLSHTGLKYKFLNDSTVAVLPAQPEEPGAEARKQDISNRKLLDSEPTSSESDAARLRSAAEAESRDRSAQTAQLDAKLEEVTVTGTRQELYTSQVVTSGVLGDKDPFDVPFSISSYSGELAKLQDAYAPIDILKNDPAVQSPGLDLYPNEVIIRGFRSAAGGMRRDGLYGNDIGDAPIEAFDRIELVRGVAGFLYGFAQPGGVQNYVTKRPTQDAFSTLELQVRSGAGRYVHVDAGGPVLNDKLGYRVNLAREDQGDFTRRGDMVRDVGAVAIDAKVTDDLLLRLDGTYQSREQVGEFGLPRTSDGLEPGEFDTSRSLVPAWARSKFESAGGGVRAEYTLSDRWKVLAQARYDRVKADLGYGLVESLEGNGDFSLSVWLPPGKSANHSTVWQLMMLGEVNTGALRHQLAFGTFSLSSEHEVSYARGEVNVQVAGNIFHPSFSARPAIPVTPYDLYVTYTTDETHYFVGDTIGIGERWDVLLGLRRADMEWEQKQVNGAPYRYDAAKTSPSAAVIFKPNDSLRFYGSYARSLQIGYSAPCREDVVNACEIQPPLEAKQYEVGAKARVASSLDLALSLYQIELPSDYVDETTHIYGRYGEQRNRGVELTAAGNIRPNLAVVVGLGYLDAIRTSNEDPSLNGARVEALARLTGSVFVNYGVSSVPGLALMGRLYRVGPRDFDIANTIEVDGYTTLDLGAQYRTQAFGLPLKLRANIHNVTDEFYWDGLWYNRYSAGRGRVYSLAVELQLF